MAAPAPGEGRPAPVVFRRHAIEASQPSHDPRQVDRFVERFDRKTLITPKPVPAKPLTKLGPGLAKPPEPIAHPERRPRWRLDWFWVQAAAACALGFKGGLMLLRGLMMAH